MFAATENTIVTITRHYSGFANIADTYSLGANEQAGNAAALDYALPAGYSVDGCNIYDPAGYRCEIVASYRGGSAAKGGPVLVNLGGRCPDVHLAPAT